MFQIKIFTFQVKDIYIYFRCAKAAYQDQLWDPMLTFVNSRVCNQMQSSIKQILIQPGDKGYEPSSKLKGGRL